MPYQGAIFRLLRALQGVTPRAAMDDLSVPTTVDGVEICLIPTARRAISTARASTPFSMEMQMSIAAVGAVIIGATDEAG
jgi:hypothetical protein